MGKLSAALLALVVLAAAVPAVAASGKPERFPANNPLLTFDAGQVCSFAIRLEPIGDKQVVKVFSNGRVMITGRLSGRISRLDAEGNAVESTTVNVSGPIVLTFNDDGTINVKGTGNTLFFFFPGDLGPGQPGALLSMTGLVEEVVNADFDEIISFSHRGGTTENLCETLAP